MADVTILDTDSADLRGYLRRGSQPLSETWSYQLFNR
jgi:glucan biosynthesis protein